jgi:hypothetical protein
MALNEYMAKLTDKVRYEVVIELLTLSLPIWEKYVDKVKVLEYTDTVVGMHHKVDHKIIEESIELSKSKLTQSLDSKRLKKIQDDFSDPVVALQDLDWELPYCEESIFYAAYNLIEKLSGKEKSTFDDELLYLVSNQTIDALTKAELYSFDEIKNTLKKFST